MWAHKIFKDIIENDEDLLGMVAYTIYKTEKIHWINSFHTKNGAYPTQIEIDNYFHNFSYTADKIKDYRSKAESKVNKFLQVALAEELTQYKETIRDEEIIKTVSKSFWESIGENVVAGVIGSLITVAFSFGVWLWQQKENPALMEHLKKNNPVSQELAPNNPK